jgi:hypothetical protein
MTADDLTGTSPPATLLGGATFSTGRVNDAFDLNGNLQSVNAGNDPSIKFGSADFTIDLWVFFRSLASDFGGDVALVEKMLKALGIPNLDGWRLLKQANSAGDQRRRRAPPPRASSSAAAS